MSKVSIFSVVAIAACIFAGSAADAASAKYEKYLKSADANARLGEGDYQ